MIVTHGYIGTMNEMDEPCPEIKEMIYRFTGEFWKQIYYFLLNGFIENNEVCLLVLQCCKLKLDRVEE